MSASLDSHTSSISFTESTNEASGHSTALPQLSTTLATKLALATIGT
ncbi:hypothetical protein JKL07_10785 [Lactiplantibacillus argentoratensis]|nr:hypothetical protein [Lactiplantibacillus argentoratensis]KTF00681.1 hypothetical protein SF2A35B_2617 [Lactiplantibacillus plantarum]KZT78478.1 hypothetical protein Nizo1839_2540 [Lactiplantibacillus plantarum]MBT1147161.1 hypothetical protein [Lactiplantibacillus argentoratensis]